jgi:hypothetical protein
MMHLLQPLLPRRWYFYLRLRHFIAQRADFYNQLGTHFAAQKTLPSFLERATSQALVLGQHSHHRALTRMANAPTPELSGLPPNPRTQNGSRLNAAMVLLSL